MVAMTVLKFSGEKKIVQNAETPEVVVDLLKQPDDVKKVAKVGVKSAPITKRYRRAFCVFLFLGLLIFLAFIAVGGYFLFCHVKRIDSDSIEDKVFETDYDVTYYDNAEELSSNRPHGTLKERYQVVGDLERIHVPKFDECDSSLVVHDFIYNYTVIVDEERTVCFVMKLNRSQVRPPTSVRDFIKKMWRGYYHPKVRTLREKFLVRTEPVRNVHNFGQNVAAECQLFTTYRLVNYDKFLKRMMNRMQHRFYGYYSMTDYIIKIELST